MSNDTQVRPNADSACSVPEVEAKAEAAHRCVTSFSALDVMTSHRSAHRKNVFLEV